MRKDPVPVIERQRGGSDPAAALSAGQKKAARLLHEIPPVFDRDSKILILGTFPSAASRGEGFFYAHPQNRFWRLLGLLTNAPVPATVAEKRALLLQNKIALWDVIARCDIVGSSDSSIRNVVPNDIAGLLRSAGTIQTIYANGASAARLYDRYALGSTGVPIRRLPSTSPANASCSLERLQREWSVMLDDLRPNVSS